MSSLQRLGSKKTEGATTTVDNRGRSYYQSVQHFGSGGTLDVKGSCEHDLNVNGLRCKRPLRKRTRCKRKRCRVKNGTAVIVSTYVNDHGENKNRVNGHGVNGHGVNAHGVHHKLAVQRSIVSANGD